MNVLEQKILVALTKDPTKSNAAIAKNYRGATAGLVASIRSHSATPDPVLFGARANEAPQAPQSSGIALRGMRVLSRRPAESAAKFIKRLPKGRGFDPKALSHDWGMSEETIRRHARDLNCLKFVEISDDEWAALVMNPETAQTYSL
jgi:hypothetical protein